MRILFAPAFALIQQLSVAANLTGIAILFAVAQAVALAVIWRTVSPEDGAFQPGALAAVALAFFALALYWLAGVGRWNRIGMGRVSATLERVATGDLSIRTGTPRANQMGGAEATRMWRALGRMNANLFEIVNQVRASADQVDHGSREIATGYSSLSQRTEQQASTLEETAAGMEELAATVKQNAELCQQANARAEETGKRAEEAGQAMHRVTSTMTHIEDGSKKMSEVIRMIEGIAFQTNLLALNAAVEAARAGDQGRGFGVVAAEVRALAQRSAQAADEIKKLIERSTREIGEGANLLDSAEQAVSRAVTAVHEVSELIASIASASEEQTTGVQQISRALTQLDGVTQQNAALVEEGAAAATSFQQEAARLLEVVGAFKLDRTADREAAVALVQRAVARFRAVGRQRAFKDFQDPQGRFMEGERYVVVWDVNGVMVGGPPTPNLGRSVLDLEDADGKKYIREILEIARTKNKGWCDYRWENLATGAIEPKSTYFECAGDFIFGCGIYRPETDRQASSRPAPGQRAPRSASAANPPLPSAVG